MTKSTTAPLIFDLSLPTFTLECAEELQRHLVRGWWWGPAHEAHRIVECSRVVDDETELAQLGKSVVRSDESACEIERKSIKEPGQSVVQADVPTILVVHALTGDMRVGGSGGWWSDAVGEGRALDPTKSRILCFNNLGSCYGSSGPEDWRFVPQKRIGTLSTWDQARSILLALDHLGIETVDVTIGGSVGGAIVLALAALAPERFKRIVPIATSEKSSPWIVAWNHIARQTILNDPHYPDNPRSGLSIARQLAHITYRAETGLQQRHGRSIVLDAGRGPDVLSPFASPYRVQQYLSVQGEKLTNRFSAPSYLALLDAVDNHDLSRRPTAPDSCESWRLDDDSSPSDLDDSDPFSPAHSWGLRRIQADVIAAAVDTDQLFSPAHTTQLCRRLRALNKSARDLDIESVHGHDGFLMESDQVEQVLRDALDEAEQPWLGGGLSKAYPPPAC